MKYAEASRAEKIRYRDLKITSLTDQVYDSLIPSRTEIDTVKFADLPIVRLLDCAEFVAEKAPSSIDTKGRVARAIAQYAYEQDITKLPESVSECPSVILPIESNSTDISGKDSAKHIEYPRTRCLMQVLSELNVDYHVHYYKIKSRQKLGCVAFVLPDLKKVIFVNNERSNSTFIVHRLKDSDDWQNFAAKSRSDLGFLTHFGVVAAEKKYTTKFNFKRGIKANLEKANKPDVDEIDIDTLLNPDNYDKAPPGAKTAAEIVRQLSEKNINTSKRFVEELMDKVEVSDEQRKGFYRVPGTSDIEMYALEATVTAIEEHLSVPEGFLNMDDVARELYEQIDEITRQKLTLKSFKQSLRKWVRSRRKKFPELFDQGHNTRTHHVVTFCDHRVVGLLRAEMGVFTPLITDNQVPLRILATELGISFDTALKMARRFADDDNGLEKRRIKPLSRGSWVINKILADKVREHFAV